MTFETNEHRTRIVLNVLALPWYYQFGALIAETFELSAVSENVIALTIAAAMTCAAVWAWRRSCAVGLSFYLALYMYEIVGAVADPLFHGRASWSAFELRTLLDWRSTKLSRCSYSFREWLQGVEWLHS